MNRLVFLIFLVIATSQLPGQSSSFVVLGDLHYDLIDDHDMEWLREKPDDLRQVTEEYTVYTEKYWDDLMEVLKNRIQITSPNVKAILQLGDLSEGLAGSEVKANQMASNTITALENAEMPVPWILVKGNHDITGPEAREAFGEYYIPFIREETGSSSITSANYSYAYDQVKIVCIDRYDNEDELLSFLDNELSNSDAKYKFVAVHEPVIPVTERCWHMYRKNPDKRKRLLEIIAKNQAIVLCGHLHRYSVVSRNTPHGKIVQVMAISVVRDSTMKTPSYTVTEYGPSIALNEPGWQPSTMESRIKMLEKEARFVDYYKQTDLSGYAIIKVDDENERIILEYYAAFSDQPYDILDLTDLYDHRAADVTGDPADLK